MRRKKSTVLASLALAMALVACGSSSSSPPSDPRQLTGAGSTLLAPLMERWQPAYDRDGGVAVAYSATGSGVGIEQITAGAVDFGASDAPLTEAQMKEAKSVVQMPWALAAVDIAYNVPGVPADLRLTGPVLAEIYMGKITTWNDARIAALNPQITLPATKITPIHQSDGSGDTFAFTDYLSHVSPEWKSSIGNALQVKFPAGAGAKANSGVASAIGSTPGAVGYIASSYAGSDGLHLALVQNSAGNYPVPGIPSISAAASTVKDVPPNNVTSIVDPPASASNAYPISTFTYAMVPASGSNSALNGFLSWAITTGQSYGGKLGFAPLPANIVAADRQTIAKREG
jgi:phosphate transport system substrate-binding protein